MGFGLGADAIHSPNENYPLEQFFNGIRTIPLFYKHFVVDVHSSSSYYLNWRTYVSLTGFYYQNRRSANFYRGLADSQKIGRIAFLIYPYSVV